MTQYTFQEFHTQQSYFATYYAQFCISFTSIPVIDVKTLWLFSSFVNMSWQAWFTIHTTTINTSSPQACWLFHSSTTGDQKQKTKYTLFCCGTQLFVSGHHLPLLIYNMVPLETATIKEMCLSFLFVDTHICTLPTLPKLTLFA
jgi:hypothetical protein